MRQFAAAAFICRRGIVSSMLAILSLMYKGYRSSVAQSPADLSPPACSNACPTLRRARTLEPPRPNSAQNVRRLSRYPEIVTYMLDQVRLKVLVAQGYKAFHCICQTPTQHVLAGIETHSVRYLLCNLSWVTEVPDFNTSTAIWGELGPDHTRPQPAMPLLPALIY
jgi:hypothetical protein